MGIQYRRWTSRENSAVQFRGVVFLPQGSQKDVDVLAETRIGFEARNPLANRMRRWSVEIGQDLLGMWLVDIEFGRIGSKGRRLRHAFFDEPSAQACVGQALRRRATAPEGIGVAYRCVHSSLQAQGLVNRAGIEMAAAGMLIA